MVSQWEREDCWAGLQINTGVQTNTGMQTNSLSFLDKIYFRIFFFVLI